MCTRYDISKISEKSAPKKIYEFENADLTTYKSIFKDVYVTKISYRIKENEKKILEVKDSKGNNLFYMNISMSKTPTDGFKDNVDFFRAEGAEIPTELQGFFTGKVYIVENDVCLRNKLSFVIEFFHLSCKTTVNDKSIEKLFKEIENSLIKESSYNVDISIIENYLTSIYEELKELNGEIKDIKEDSYSRQKFIAKKIINSIDEYLCNRKKYNEILQDKPFFILIISRNSLKYDPETQRYLKEFKLLLDDITVNEKQIIGSALSRNCSSSNQFSKDELIDKKKEIDEIEAAIDNSLLDIVKHVQTGRQWFVKEYEEGE
ncbi:hypothetical protein NBO_10g0094, partial [Nosema bombycis CQ1]